MVMLVLTALTGHIRASNPLNSCKAKLWKLALAANNAVPLRMPSAKSGVVGALHHAGATNDESIAGNFFRHPVNASQLRNVYLQAEGTQEKNAKALNYFCLFLCAQLLN